MLELEVSPEEGLIHTDWQFILGMHFSQAVAIVQSQVRIIKSAHVIYNDQNPLNHDLILDLPGDGFRLIFESKSQRLKLIEVYSLKLIRLKYGDTFFNGAEVIPTVHQIDRCFGATRPGTFDKERGVFALNFRGLSFYFPVDSKFEPHYSHGLGSLRFPGEATPILNRLVIYVGSNGCPAEAPVPVLPLVCFRGNVYCEECKILRNATHTTTLGLSLKLFSQSVDELDALEGEAVHFERELYFGESAQSIAAKLGAPMKVYYKSDDKMKIHSKEAHKRVASEKADFFFNYFTLGLDVLFDASTNLATKFILHTNFPGHYDFTDYYRSPFVLTLGRSSPTPTSTSTFLQNLNPNPAAQSLAQTEAVTTTEKVPVPSGGKGKGKKKNNSNNNNGAKGKSTSSSSASTSEKSSPPSDEGSSLPGNSSGILMASTLEIQWDTRWEEVRNFLWAEKMERAKLDKPVVLTRSSASNPFGPSLCYGVQDMIFEVMSNDHLATVTFYYTTPPDDHEMEVENIIDLDLNA